MNNRPKAPSLYKEQLSAKIPAKTPYRQRKLAGQSSALPANRQKPQYSNVKYKKTYERDNPHYNDKNPRLQSLSKELSQQPLTDDQIKNSAIYKLLEEEISNLAKRQEQEIAKMLEIKKSKEKELIQLKTDGHAIKLQIWELKDEAMDLKDAIKEEIEEGQRLAQELGEEEADYSEDNYLNDDYEEGDDNQSEDRQPVTGSDRQYRSVSDLNERSVVDQQSQRIRNEQKEPNRAHEGKQSSLFNPQNC